MGIIRASNEQREDGIYLVETDGDGRTIHATKINNVSERYISIWDFRRRFTAEELVAITAASMSDPVLATARDDLAAAENGKVNLDNPAVTMYIDYLISKELLTAERKAQILA